MRTPSSWLFPHPSPAIPMQHQRDLPSQTRQELLVAPWAQVDQGGLDHQGAPVGQGSQVSHGCPGEQRCSIS